MKYKKCTNCQYKDRPQNAYPCSRCEENKQYPLTCRDCRSQCYRYGNRKSLIICKNFEWD